MHILTFVVKTLRQAHILANLPWEIPDDDACWAHLESLH